MSSDDEKDIAVITQVVNSYVKMMDCLTNKQNCYTESADHYTQLSQLLFPNTATKLQDCVNKNFNGWQIFFWLQHEFQTIE